MAGTFTIASLSNDELELVLRRTVDEQGCIPSNVLQVSKLFHATVRAIASSLRLLHLPTAPLAGASVTKLSVSTGCRHSLTDEHVAHMGSLSALQHADLCDCQQLTGGALLHLAALTNVTALTLSGVFELIDGDLVHLALLPRLERLELEFKMMFHESKRRPDSSDFGDPGLAHLAALTRLTCLFVACPHATDAGMACLSAHTNLKRLQLECQGATDAGLARLAALTRLQHLDLTSVDREGLHGYEFTDKGLAHLAGLTALTHLSMAYCGSVRGWGLARLSVLQSLRSLGLFDFEQLNDEGLDGLRKHTALTQLRLGGYDSMTGEGIARLLGKLKRLRELHLGCFSQSPLTSASFEAAADCVALTRLQLDCETLTDLRCFSRLHALQHMSLLFASLSRSHTNLACLSALTALRQLELICCKQVVEDREGRREFVHDLHHLTSPQLLKMSHIELQGLRAFARALELLKQNNILLRIVVSDGS